MRRLMFVICFCLISFPMFCQAASRYQVATITDVKVHKSATVDNPPPGASTATSYDVTLSVGGTSYLVLYTPPLGMGTVKYATGRELLVMVEDKTIRFNDITGQTFEVPIVSQKPAASTARSK